MQCRRPLQTDYPLSAREGPLQALQLPVPGRLREPLLPHGPWLEAAVVRDCMVPEMPSPVPGLGGGPQGGLQGSLV